jgi:sugar phosphate permease
VTAPSYRWVVLGAGVVAQASSAAVLQGLPGLAPQLRTEYGVGLTGLGVLLASVTFGLVSTLVLWGALADRLGERRVMATGLVLAFLALLAARQTTSIVALTVWLALAGAACGSVNAASGRSVLGWFGPAERGFAMGIRQTALPLGAGLSAAVLPPLAVRHGLGSAFGALAGYCLLAAVVVVLLVREAPAQAPRVAGGPRPLADPVIRRLFSVSLLLVVPQFAVVAFLVVYLVDEQDVPVAAAALMLAGVQLVGGASRIVTGRWSDRVGRRLDPLRRVAIAVCVLFVGLVLCTLQGGRVVVPVLLLAGVVAISWNGLAFTAVGELAGPGRAGTALGVQNTAVGLGAALTPPLLGALVDRTAWPAAYAVAALAAGAAALLLGPVARREARVMTDAR